MLRSIAIFSALMILGIVGTPQQTDKSAQQTAKPAAQAEKPATATAAFVIPPDVAKEVNPGWSFKTDHCCC